jgi:hypothetical protein
MFDSASSTRLRHGQSAMSVTCRVPRTRRDERARLDPLPNQPLRTGVRLHPAHHPPGDVGTRCRPGCQPVARHVDTATCTCSRSSINRAERRCLLAEGQGKNIDGNFVRTAILYGRSRTRGPKSSRGLQPFNSGRWPVTTVATSTYLRLHPGTGDGSSIHSATASISVWTSITRA